MGQYYRFINRDRTQVSTIVLPFNFGLSWAKDLDRLSSEQVKAQLALRVGMTSGDQLRHRPGK